MPQHVLLVDDDIELRDLSQKFLERSGYKVTTAGDGWDAIREIVVNKPDIVVMDIEMPKLSGLNALDILRVSRLTDQIPIIVTSGHGDKDTILRTVQLGADDFIVKPYSPTELVSRIVVHLFQLGFNELSDILNTLRKNPAVGKTALAGLDPSQYENWGLHATQYGEHEISILLQRGMTLKQAAELPEDQARLRIMVLAKFRNAWKCVWPSPLVDTQPKKKSA